MEEPARRIVVPIDFSDHAHAACERAFAFAARSGAEVELLHAYPPPASIAEADTPATLLGQIRAREGATFEHFCDEYAERGYAFSDRLHIRVFGAGRGVCFGAACPGCQRISRSGLGRGGPSVRPDAGPSGIDR